MQKRLNEFDKLNIQVKVVSFAPPESVQSYIEQFDWKFEIFSDPQREVYKLFGLGRAKPWKIFHPRTIIKFVKLLTQGAKIQKTKEDEFQMGGDFLIDAEGRLCYIFQSETPDDRPTVEELLTVCRSIMKGGLGK